MLHRRFLILFRIENLPQGGFPSTCLIIFIHHVHAFIYLCFSSFPLFFLFFLCFTSLSDTHTSVLAMMESSSALLTGSLMKRIRVLSSTSGLSTPILYRKHTQRCAHTHTHKYRLILMLCQLITLRQSTKLKFSSAYKCVLPFIVATIS